jgi:tetratricopeptide (TPR) repeat protein
MIKVGRNQPCPCGSGKKYKQCCLSNDEVAALAARELQQRDAPSSSAHALPSGWRAIVDENEWIDRMSNQVIDLIHTGELDEAERLCHRLIDEFPDLPDGHMRLGQLFRARGEPSRAAQHLRLAAAVARAGDADSEMPVSLEADADSLDPPAP